MLETVFTVPTTWDDRQITAWVQRSAGRIESVYGSRQVQFMGHGRAPKDTPPVTDSQIIQHAHHVKRLGINFIYLMNGLCQHIDLNASDAKEHAIADIIWVVEEVQADCIVVADIRVARLIRSLYNSKSVGIRVSTVVGVQRPDQLIPWLSLDIEGVVLHHDCSRDISGLQHLSTWINQNYPNVSLELLVNESCLHGCSSRSQHYASLAKAGLNYIEGFQQDCNIPKFKNPAILLSAGWVRPEDIHIYRELGIRRFKLAGREMSPEWLDRAIRAYLDYYHPGNFVELLTMTPPGMERSASDVFYLSNPALEGFLNGFLNAKDFRIFCKEYSAKLWESGDLSIHDPTASYSLENGSLRCTTPGNNFIRLQDLQVYRDPSRQYKAPLTTVNNR